MGVVLVGYMAFIFYQSLKGGIAYKKEFENFKNSHKHYETMVDGGYWISGHGCDGCFGICFDVYGTKISFQWTTYYYYLRAYGCIGLVFYG